MNQKFLTLHECAEYLRLSVPTLYSYTSKRKIPFIKLGKNILFEVADLETFVASHKQGANNG